MKKEKVQLNTSYINSGMRVIRKVYLNVKRYRKVVYQGKDGDGDGGEDGRRN